MANLLASEFGLTALVSPASAMAVLSPALQVVAANQAYVELADVPEQQLIGSDAVQALDLLRQHETLVRESLERVMDKVVVDAILLCGDGQGLAESDAGECGSAQPFEACQLLHMPLRDAQGRVSLIIQTLGREDVQQLQHQAAAARTSLQLVLDAGRVISWEWDLLQDYAEVDDRLGQRVFGRRSGNQEDFLAVVHPEDRQHVKAWFDAVIRGDTVDDLTYRVTAPNGEIHWLLARGQVERDERGQAVRVRGVSADVTSHMLAEQKLRESESRIRGLFEQASLGIAEINPQGRFTLVNQKLCDMLGYTCEQLLQMKVEDVTAEEDVRWFVSACRQIANGEKETGTWTKRCKAHDGSVIWSSVSASGLGEGSPERPRNVVAIVEDITQRIHAERALRDSEERFRLIFNQAAIGITLAQLDGPLIDFNARFCQIMGYPREELMGMSFVELTHPEDREGNLTANKILLDSGKNFTTVEKRYVRKDGQIVWAIVGITVLRDSEGQPQQYLAMVQDISSRKRAEQALKEGEERLRLALRSADAGLWDWDLKTQKLTWSPEYFRLVGLNPDRDQPSLETWLMRVHPDDRKRVMAAVRNASEGGKDQKLEYRIVHPTRGVRWISRIGRAVTDTHGEPIRTIGISLDITERKEAEKLGARLTNLFKTSSDAIISYDPQGMIETWNPAAEKMYGYRADEIIGKSIHQIVPADRAEEINCLIESVRQGKAIAQFETTRVRRDGQRVEIELNLWPIQDETGQVLAISGIGRNVTERRRAAEALRESEERFRLAAECTNDLIYEWMLGTSEVRWYSDIDAALGYPQGQVAHSYEAWLEALHPEDRHWVDATLTESIASARSFALEYRVRRADGSVRYWADRGTIVKDESGRPFKVIGGITDMTDRKLAEQQLKQLNETLERRVAERTAVAEERAEQLQALAVQLTQAEQQERRRLAQTLHDHLQQLLVAAKLRMSMLASHGESAEFRQAVAQVDDLLAQSIEASRSLTVELSPPILYDAGLAAAMDWLARWMQEKHGLHVHVDADEQAQPSDNDVCVFLFQAARELLFNIVKHAKVDDASITMRRYDGSTQLIIADRGQGFDAEKVSNRSQRKGGFGLFSIQQRIELLGGSFYTESKPGQGCSITLEVPREALPKPTTEALMRMQGSTGRCVARAAKKPTGQTGGGQIRVVLADDHKILREGLAGLLRNEADINVIAEADNGEMAVQLAHEHHPDVVVMDVTMPRLNGVEATRRIANELPDVHVIGLSIHEKQDMAAAMRDAGAVAYHTKGGPSQALIASIRACAKKVERS